MRVNVSTKKCNEGLKFHSIVENIVKWSLLEMSLDAFCHSTIPQKQFIKQLGKKWTGISSQKEFFLKALELISWKTAQGLAWQVGVKIANTYHFGLA